MSVILECDPECDPKYDLSVIRSVVLSVNLECDPECGPEHSECDPECGPDCDPKCDPECVLECDPLPHKAKEKTVSTELPSDVYIYAMVHVSPQESLVFPLPFLSLSHTHTI